MLLTFPHFKVRHQIHEQRREDLSREIKLRQMARIFESADERRQREALERLRGQDWKH